jgi:hypothetical protein
LLDKVGGGDLAALQDLGFQETGAIPVLCPQL